ncbi:hypothetical protein EDB81DRAFT_819136 [Dactylonectria macrodidyma]|uniref:Uncharacterized protein n=1 Tax=Dactylonectria macrodidyma TaxID=307937 RepID=A0A9P9IE12_9HYPO|nr:hypothetical protein EDB81DRAFT_819136 [Dactylonectria macrodidyma]
MFVAGKQSNTYFVPPDCFAMPKFLGVIPIVHTRSWKDRDVKRNLPPPGREHLDARPLDSRCSCLGVFPLASSCMLHHEMSRDTLDNVSTHRPWLLDESLLLGTLPNSPTRKDCPDIWESRKRKSQPPQPAHEQLQPLYCKNVATKELDTGNAVRHAETEILHFIGGTDNEREQLCEHFYGSSEPRRSRDGHDAAFLSSSNSVCHYVLGSKDRLPNSVEEEVDEYEQWIWKSFQEWTEYMCPDANRKCD